MGFPSARASTFHRFLDKAIKNGFVKVQQNGFRADSMHHHKIIIQLKDFNPIRLINAVAEVPSWANKEINGYKLTMNRSVADNLSVDRQKSRPESDEVLAANQSKRRGTRPLHVS